MSDPTGPEEARAGGRRPGLGRTFGGDDLVTGLDREGRPPGVRAFFAVTLAASLFVFDLTFTLGAYHTVFYTRMLQILVVSTVLLLGSIVLRRYVRVRWWSRVLLAVPLLWFAQRLIAPAGRATAGGRALDHLLIGLTVACVPFMLLVITRVLTPEYFELPRRRFKIVAIVIVVLVAVGGFLVGLFNYRVVTCQDYIVAGNDTPANCRQQPFAPPK